MGTPAQPRWDPRFTVFPRTPDDNSPEKPDPKMKSGSLPSALRSGLNIALFLFLVVLVSYLGLNFVLALVDKLR